MDKERLRELAGITEGFSSKVDDDTDDELIQGDKSTIGRLAHQLVDAAIDEFNDEEIAKKAVIDAADQIHEILLDKIEELFRQKYTKEIF